MKTHIEKLIKMNACLDGIKWAGGETSSIEELVEKCHRGDWLLWLAWKVGVDEKAMFIAKALCAHTVIHLMKDESSRNAVRAAFLYGRGKISKGELKAAAAAAAANADADAVYAAYTAASASAADAATNAVYTAYAAAAAVHGARRQNQMKTADICRKIIGTEIITKFNDLTQE